MHNSGQGKLYQSDGPWFANRVFFVEDDVRHWILSADWCGDNGFVWPSDIERTTDDKLLSLKPGRPFGKRWNVSQPESLVATDSLQLREVACSFLHGNGLEIGAGSNPLPIPRDCNVSYADVFTLEELKSKLYPGQKAEDLVKPAFRATLEDLGEVNCELDFIAAAHVIEHVPDPIGAIIRAASKLRSGGHLLLMIPDMKETFDRNRKLTALDHLLLDFYAPSRERDKTHYKEFYEVSFVTPFDLLEYTWTKNWEDNFPIHYHTWTFLSFDEMIRLIIKETGVYKYYWSHTTRGNEFCFVLERS